MATSFGSNSKSVTRIIGVGILVIVVLLAITGLWLLATLPDGNAFNERVEAIFIANDALTGQGDIKFLEILAQSGTAFADTLSSYRVVIFVLLILATALLVATLVFLALLVTLTRQLARVEASGIQVNSLYISRAENLVLLNNMEFTLTPAAMETLATLAEARMDGDMLSGSELEGLIAGKPAADCDEAAGATRIKRLRDTMGNQLVSTLLVRNVARKGYMLAIDKDVIDLT
ncbi:MAG: winged helix-turn-helix domain-containing protein [Planktomarina sp.]